MNQKSYFENAKFLLAYADPNGPPVTFYDEDDETTHDLENGVLSISTDLADYTTYKLKLAADQLEVEVERLDNYKLHDKAKVIACEIDADEEADLAERLERLVEQIKTTQKKKATKSTGTKAKDLKALEAMLVSAGEWEWKEWAEIGTSSIQRASKENNLGLSLESPNEKQTKSVFAGADFSKSVLEWFRKQLGPQGWTLVAVPPLDELQAFALVRNEDLESARALLKKQGRKLH